MAKHILFTVLLTLGFAFASSFIPENMRQNSIPDSETLNEMSQGNDVFYIDDMAFNTERVSRSGFTGERWTNGVVYYEL